MDFSGLQGETPVMPISIIIPVRNEGQRIIRTIQSLVFGRSCRFPLEIVVVDDASTDGACNGLAQLNHGMPEVRVIIRRLNSWSGIPYARNRGAEAATYPIFLMTDGNTCYPKNWDQPIRRNFHRSRLLAGTIADLGSPFCGYGCALVLPSMGITWMTTAHAYGGYAPVAPCTCTVIDQALFHQLGGYDETLPLYGAAEPEFSVRTWLSGYEIVNLPDLLVHHRFRPAAEYNAFRAAISGILLRSYLRFACYYLPEALLRQTYDYYQAWMPHDFDECLAQIIKDGVWTRRDQLKQQLPLDFSWFARKFSLAIPQKSPEVAPRPSINLSVVVLTHGAYLHWLPDVLASIERQRSAIQEVILVVDSAGAKLPAIDRFGELQIIIHKFASPNQARNAGLAEVKSDWVCYVDGDNIPDPGYFAHMRKLASQVPDDVAILYPDLKRVRQDGWTKPMPMPEWDFWVCREKSIIDTCSAWRTKALRQSGGWFTPATCLQDYTTVLKVTQQGWKARKARGLTATLRDHPGNLSKRIHGIADALWNARRYAVVTLFSGRRHSLPPLMGWYAKETFPPDTHLIWVDDSNDAAFHALLWRHAESLRDRAASVQIWKNTNQCKDLSNFEGLHNHIGGMYNRVIASVKADIYLTVEDDVIAPAGSVRRMLDSGVHVPYSRWGGVCAVYPSRNSKDKRYMVASRDKERWTKCPLIENFPAEVVEMGMIGAGFSAWNGVALHKVLPVHSSDGPCDHRFGWDGTMCVKIAKLGYKLGIDGRIHCQHLFT